MGSKLASVMTEQPVIVTAAGCPAEDSFGAERPSFSAGPRERAAFLDLLLQATQDGIVDWDLVTDREHYNPRWSYLFGFDDEDASQTSIRWRELIHPDEADDAARLLQDHLEQNWPFVATLRMRHRHAGFRSMLCRGAALRDAQGRPVRMVIIFSDISERIELEARQRALASALPDTVFRVSSSGVILELKRGEDHELSPFRSLVQGAELRDCLPERIARCLESSLRLCKAESATRSLELSTPRGPACTVHHEVRLVQSVNDEWVCIVRDITSQHALADQLMQSQKLGAIGELAAGVAHEINTPMQYIGDNLHFAHGAIADLLGFIDRVRELALEVAEPAAASGLESALDEAEEKADLTFVRSQLPRAIERSLDGIARMTTIVSALKTFAHPGGREMTPVDLKSLLEATAAVATNEWKYVAELTVSVDPALPAVTCAGGEISQVVLNLIVNAAHAVGAKVAGTEAKGHISVSAHASGDNVEIRVTDDGTGIPEHAQPRVFEPFFTTKDVGKGTGQGLAMAHTAIVNHHQGTIHFETEPGKGTTFIVTIPIAGSPANAIAEEASGS
jgi:PAS domain S-box-containing protein